MLARASPAAAFPTRLASSPAFLLLALALAGCSGSPVPGAVDDGLAAGGETAAMAWTYRTLAPERAPYVRDYAGVANHPTDPAGPDFFQGIPGGPAQGPFQTCCLFTWVPAPDLFGPDEISLLRVTLNWTNTQSDQANLDIAVCVSWYCGFAEMPDQTNQLGEHSETFDLMSGGRDDFPGFYGDGVPTVGARYSNGVFTAAGVPYSVHVEVVPVADALAFVDPYEVEVPAGSTLQAELVGPVRGDGLAAGLMVYGDADLPIAYHELAGAHGSVHDLGHGEGTYVVAPFVYQGAVLRLKANATAEPAPARRLQETFGTTVVAALADPAEKAGTFTFDAPPGSLDTFPFFLADAGAQAANGPTTQSAITLSSSAGVVADVRGSIVGAAIPQFGNVCLTCSTGVEWNPENYVDDDGSYDVAYASKGATGRFVLFTATYSR